MSDNDQDQDQNQGGQPPEVTPDQFSGQKPLPAPEPVLQPDKPELVWDEENQIHRQK